MPEDDDTTLFVERLVAKSSAALGQAYDLYHESVRSFTRRLLGDDAAAEDLVQETFIALPGAARKYNGSCSLKTFLTAIAVNRARHHLRAAARRRAAMARLGLQIAAPAFTPEEQAGSGQLAEALVLLLDQLPVDQRIAFVLCEVEERTSSEAAVIVGASQATVRSRVFHAKRKLREALARGGLR
jgi:RNA polymerase sigma-70 factor (ECF subfamily)